MINGLITAAGLGTRSGLDGKFRKEMLSLYDIRDGKIVLRPVIDIVIFRMKNAGIRRIAVILNRSDRITYDYINREFPEVEIIYQDKPDGFGNAVYMGRELFKEGCLLNAGDGFILDPSYYKNLIKGEESKLTLFEVENPEHYGNAKINDKTGVVEEVIEKPPNPLSKLALAAVYYFKEPFYEFLDVERVEFTDYIRNALLNNYSIKYNIIKREEWVSVGKVENYVKSVEKTYKYFKNFVTT
ncbi:sugar phosphate nucleotidyltransferase [Cuniculiplasma sp. SKW3]|uniref:sugar phosphate nucleotidyltransferase n=1 Tax=unclassified Cuniculiplasma TaxID=2619706 RepID=UPI003FCF58A8